MLMIRKFYASREPGQQGQGDGLDGPGDGPGARPGILDGPDGVRKVCRTEAIPFRPEARSRGRPGSGLAAYFRAARGIPGLT